MHDFPYSAHEHWLEPPAPVEYEIEGIATLRFDEDVAEYPILLQYVVRYEREREYSDLLDHERMIADMWDPLVEYVQAQLPHFDAATLIDDVTINRVRETM